MSIDFNILIWSLINFTILFAVLAKFFYKPILAMMEDRRKEITEGLRLAEENRHKAESLHADYEKKMDEAAAKARKIIDEAVSSAESRRVELVEKAQNEAASILDQAKKSIERQKDMAIKELREEVATLAVMAAGKVLDKSMSVEDHRRLVDQAVQEAGEAQ